MRLLISLKEEIGLSREEKEVLTERIEKLLVYYRIYKLKKEGIIFSSSLPGKNIGVSLEDCSLRHSGYAGALIKVIAESVANFFGQKKVDYTVHFKPAPKIRGTFLP